MADSTRPFGLDLVPPPLLGRVAVVIEAAEAILREVDRVVLEADGLFADVEQHLRGLTDDDHRAAAESAGLVRLMTLIDRMTGGEGR